jgi:hypothetical protein
MIAFCRPTRTEKKVFLPCKMDVFAKLTSVIAILLLGFLTYLNVQSAFAINSNSCLDDRLRVARSAAAGSVAIAAVTIVIFLIVLFR